MGQHSQAAVTEAQRVAAVRHYAEQMVAAAGKLGVHVRVERKRTPLDPKGAYLIDVWPKQPKPTP